MDGPVMLNAVAAVNSAISQDPAERLVQVGFLQRLQRGQLLLVDGGRALVFGFVHVGGLGR